MLFSRALSNGVRWFCPDIFGGAPVYDPEELGATVNGETGEIIDVTPQPVQAPPVATAAGNGNTGKSANFGKDCAGVCNGSATLDGCGICSGGTTGLLPNCDDANPCTNDACDGSGGCLNTAINCDDGDTCTTDFCDLGQCFFDAMSGSGKSTLLNILGGLDAPADGTVRFRDHDLVNASERELTRFRREHVGFVFQFYNLIPSLTAQENVALVAEIAEHPMAPDEALRRVGLAARLDHFPSQLSGGEQQRVAIARAIVKRPDVLLCDEPTGAPDVETGKLVLEALTSVNRELGTTTAVITHNVAIAGLADRVLHMRDGRIATTERNTVKRQPHELEW